LFEKQKNLNISLSDTYHYVFVICLRFHNLVGLNMTVCGRNVLPSHYDKLIIELWWQWNIPFVVVVVFVLVVVIVVIVSGGGNYCHLKALGVTVPGSDLS